MQMSTRFGLTGIAALALLTAVHQLRGIEWSPHPAGVYLIGVLPNFAAAIAITFVLLSIRADQQRNADWTSTRRAFLACAAISGVGLLAWELFQRTSDRLVFDPHDIAATFVGLGVAGVLFIALTAPLRVRR